MNDGGPAFPRTHIIGINGMLHDAQSIGGMSLRAYFANGAMKSLIGALGSRDEVLDRYIEHATANGRDIYSQIAEHAIKHADALIAALEVKP